MSGYGGGIVKAGIGFGTALAITISCTANKSLFWVIVHGILGWIYVAWYALDHHYRRRAYVRGPALAGHGPAPRACVEPASVPTGTAPAGRCPARLQLADIHGSAMRLQVPLQCQEKSMQPLVQFRLWLFITMPILSNTQQKL